MSVIFHKFRDAAWALSFGESAQATWGVDWSLCSTQEHSDCIDPFPYALQPPIVVMDLPDGETEAALERAVMGFYGEMAGT